MVQKNHVNHFIIELQGRPFETQTLPLTDVNITYKTQGPGLKSVLFSINSNISTVQSEPRERLFSVVMQTLYESHVIQYSPHQTQLVPGLGQIEYRCVCVLWTIVLFLHY